MSELSEELTETVNDIVRRGDRDGLLELHALGDRIDDGLWERAGQETSHLREQGDWPVVNFDNDTQTFEVEEHSETVCRASIRQATSPRQTSPDYRGTLEFSGECRDRHKRAITIYTDGQF
jgi:hypothetical protein